MVLGADLSSRLVSSRLLWPRLLVEIRAQWTHACGDVMAAVSSGHGIFPLKLTVCKYCNVRNRSSLTARVKATSFCLPQCLSGGDAQGHQVTCTALTPWRLGAAAPCQRSGKKVLERLTNQRSRERKQQLILKRNNSAKLLVRTVCQNPHHPSFFVSWLLQLLRCVSILQGKK